MDFQPYLQHVPQILFTLEAKILMAFLIGGVLVLFLLRSLRSNDPDVDHDKKRPSKTQAKGAAKEKKPTKVNQKPPKKHNSKEQKVDPWTVATLKGQGGNILHMDIPMNGKYLATCADDRTVWFWDIRAITEKHQHTCRSFRFNLDGESANLVCLSPDIRAFLIGRADDATCRVYKLDKRKDAGGNIGFNLAPTTKRFVHHADGQLVALSIAPNGHYLLTCAGDTVIHVWDPKRPNQVVHRLDTGLAGGGVRRAVITPSGRFIAAAGGDGVLRMWRVRLDDAGDFAECTLAFDVNARCADFACDRSDTRVVAVDAKGAWELYQIDKAVPRLLDGGVNAQGGDKGGVALSPHAESFVIAAGRTLSFYKVRFNGTVALHRAIVDLPHDVTAIRFDASGDYLFCACSDRQIRVFRNATKLTMEMERARAQLKEQLSSATRERLTKLVDDIDAQLKEMCS